MTEVVSIQFKNRGKTYFFDPAGLQIQPGESVIVDTANGMELAVCSRENHQVDDNAVVRPLRRVLRKATQMDLRAEELSRQREQSAMVICRDKIAEHGLDMKLVDVECNFEGTKTTFFFTSDGRVDFRALVKDLASILHNRIELRQIGVRDEAKMLGGLGICGRPYCCSLFMDDFHPVSTKMAKVQSLSLNPAKISGSCGRLMCCLRYEQEAYEDLVKKVPKQGAFVETKDGYGTAVQVNLLRSTVKVRLDDDREDVLHEYKDYELTAVPGGRPKDGSPPPHVLEYVEPDPIPEEPEPDEWESFTDSTVQEPEPDDGSVPVNPEAAAEAAEASEEKGRRSRNRRKAARLVEADPASAQASGKAAPAGKAPQNGKNTPSGKSSGNAKAAPGKKESGAAKKDAAPGKAVPEPEKEAAPGKASNEGKKSRNRRKKPGAPAASRQTPQAAAAAEGSSASAQSHGHVQAAQGGKGKPPSNAAKASPSGRKPAQNLQPAPAARLSEEFGTVKKPRKPHRPPFHGKKPPKGE